MRVRILILTHVCMLGAVFPGILAAHQATLSWKGFRDGETIRMITQVSDFEWTASNPLWAPMHAPDPEHGLEAKGSGPGQGGTTAAANEPSRDDADVQSAGGKP